MHALSRQCEAWLLMPLVCVQVIRGLVNPDVRKRWTIQRALEHKFFTS
jgi:hypothetical protein